MTPQPSTPTTNATGVKSPRRRSRAGGLLNLILLIGIIATIGLFVWAEQQRRATEAELNKTVTQLEEVKKSTREGGQALAEQVLSKLRTHMDIPAEPVPTVATIVDINALRESNEFYNIADNGDHLIITEKRAILYDPERDIVLDVVPVTLNRATPTPGTVSAPSTEPTPSASATTAAPNQPGANPGPGADGVTP